jgi:hypothetical protein
MLVAILSMPGGDPRSYGGESSLAASLSYLYALVSGVLLWVVLGILLWSGWRNGGMPRWAGIGAGVLFGLSGIAAAVATGLSYSYPEGWLILVSESLPPLIALYAIWARLPALHAVLRPDITSGALLGVIAVVIIATLPLWYLDALQFLARMAREDEANNAFIAQREQAKFQRLTPDSPLLDYLEMGLDRELAVAGARQVTSRQSDAVMLLKEGKIGRLENLWRFDLEATPALCEAFGAALHKEIEDELNDGYLKINLEVQLPNMKWLVAEHCNLDDGVTAAETRIRPLIPEMQPFELPRWQQFLAALAELRQKR